MGERYIVTSSGINKEGKPYSFLAPIREGLSKAGNRYAFIDTERAVQRENESKIGSILEVTMQFSQIPPQPPQVPQPPQTKA